MGGRVGAANRHFQMRSGLNDIHCATVLQLERHSLAAPPSPARHPGCWVPAQQLLHRLPPACMPACRIPAGWSLFWCNLPPTHAHTRRTRAPAPPPPPPSPTPAPPSVVYASYPHTAGVVRVGNRSFRPAPGLHDALAGPPPHPHPHARPPSPHVRRDAVPPHAHLAPRRRELRPLFSRRVAAV